MIVVEPGTGRQKAYSSVRELGAAIRRGELGAEARIYHRTTDQWLPITIHPEYRRVAAEHERRHALAMRSRQWTFLPGEGDRGETSASEPDLRHDGPVLIPGEPEPGWIGSTFRRLKSLAHL